MHSPLKRLAHRFWQTASLAVAALLAFAAGCSRNTNVDGILASADQHFEKREFEAAKIQYINVLKVQGTNAHAAMRLGRIFFDQGQVQYAFPLLIRAREFFPQEISVREALTVIYTLAGTNLWKAEVDAILQKDPANETGITTLVRFATTPEAVQELTNRLAELRARAGNRAVYHLAEGELARRAGNNPGSIAAYRRALEAEPSSITAASTLGNALYADGNTAEGLAMLTKAAEMSPPYGLARLRLAQVLLLDGKTPEATKILDEINAKAPEVIPAWSTRAEVAYIQRNFPEARRLISRALNQSQSDPQSLRIRAKIDLAENKPADAVEALESASKWMPNNADVHYQLAIAYLLNKDTDRAVERLRRTLELNRNSVEAALLLSELEIARAQSVVAISRLTQIVQRAPQLGQARMLLARAYRATGRLDDAIATYTPMLTLFPTNATPAVQLGILLVQKNRLKEAREVFEKCLTIDPKNPVTTAAAFDQLVRLDLKSGDRAAAMARIDAKLREKPNDPPTLLIKAELLLVAGDQAGSEKILRRLLEIVPDSQPALMELAKLYISTQRRTEALAELNRAVEKDPKNVGVLTLIGMLHSEAGRYTEARDAYNRAIKEKSDASLALNNLAYLLAEKLNDLPGALQVATRARQSNPKSPTIADTLGWIEFRRGNHSEALRLIIDAAEELGQNPEVQYHLGMAYLMMGQEAPAKIALNEAVKSEATFEGKEAAKGFLRILELPKDAPSPEILRALEARRAEMPTDVAALTRLAAAYAASASPQKAIEAYEAALKVNPKLPDALGQLALLALDQPGGTNRALELVRQARQLAPGDPGVTYVAGRVSYRAGDYAVAFGLLQESARERPGDPAVAFDFAIAAYAMGQVEQATSLMNSLVVATNQNPFASQARTFLDLVAFAAKPSPAAIEPPILQALQSSPQPLQSRFAAARLAEARQNTAEAREMYEKILVQFPQFIPAARQLALLLAKNPGEEGKAYDLSLRLRKDLPRDTEIAASLGKLACQRGDFRFSVQLLTEAVRSRPEDAESLFQLGVAHVGLKQKSEGKLALERALAASPNSAFAPEAKKILTSLSSTNL